MEETVFEIGLLNNGYEMERYRVQFTLKELYGHQLEEELREIAALFSRGSFSTCLR